jgi:hypothetical protein
MEIGVAAGSQKLIVEGNQLLVSGGTEAVRYLGRELDIFVPKNVEILGKSCFQGCNHIERILFENGSQLRTICRCALASCESLKEIWIPASVEVIGDSAFEMCNGLESCLIGENGNLVRIEKNPFSNCFCLSSFYIPRSVESIGDNCFNKCRSLSRLGFASGESLKTFIGDLNLDEALEKSGLSEISSLFQIEIDVDIGIEEGRMDFCFPGWSSVVDVSSHLVLVQDVA